jgi:hypothetical protein
LAAPVVETVEYSSLTGSMKRLFVMKEPAKYETVYRSADLFANIAQPVCRVSTP